jgi:iron(III) transport system ATP-binding protein
VINVTHLDYSIDNTNVLLDVSFKIEQGSKVAIVGKSGAGKSSLLKLIAGILHPTAGEISFEDERIRSAQEKLLPGIQDIQLVSQDFGLEIYHTVYQNIENKLGHLNYLTKENFIHELLDLMDLQKIQDQKVIVISGGEQQRLSIARALASEPKVILFDEPFVYLDVHIKARLLEYLKKLHKRRNTTYVLVTHDGREAFGFCDKAIYISKGKINRYTSLKNFYCKPKSKQEALFFGEINTVVLKNKPQLLRPNHYRLSTKDEKDAILVKLLTSKYYGTHFMNTICLNDGQNVLLSSVLPFDNECYVVFI